MIKVLVTGARSQLAQALAHTQAAYPGFQVTFQPRHELDITNLCQLRTYLSAHPINYLVNCAAYTDVDKAEQEQAQAFAVNALGPGYLASLAKDLGFTLFHISTDYVFEGKLAQPLTESMPTKPVNYYGQTKLAGEQRVLAQSSSAYIVRTSWLYGAVGTNFFTKLLARASQDQVIRMVYEQISSPTYAHDLAKALWAMIDKLTQAPGAYPPGIYHYANEGVASRYDWAWSMIKQAGLACRVIPGLSSDFPGLAQRPAYSVLSKEKIKQTFDLSIPHWQESLCRCIDGLNTAL